MRLFNRVMTRLAKASAKVFLRAIASEDIRGILAEVAFDDIRGDFMRLGRNSRIDFPWNRVEGLDRIAIGNNFRGNKGLYLGAYGPRDGQAQISIGDNVVINFDSQITAINKVVIGDDVLTGSRILISDHSHGEISFESLKDPPLRRPLVSKGPVLIGNRVWIGSGVAIMPGVEIGDDCIIGANSVVTKSFPPRSVLAGNPARLLRLLA